MEERKNLVTCTPTEFMYQTNRIRKRADSWFKATGIADIRKRKADIEEIPKNATDAEKEAINERNREKVSALAKENVGLILNAVMEEHPQETLELLALACFVEPEHVDDHKVSFYLRNLSDILSDEDVIGFFTSLASLGKTGILNL